MVLASMLYIACSDDDEAEAPPPASATDTPEAATTLAPVSIITADNSFSPTSITARVGQEVVVDLKNDGQRPHTFTIDGIVDSGRLAAGESKTVEFTPSQSGTLTLYCTVHGQAQMSGTVNVSGSASSQPSGPSGSPAGSGQPPAY